MEPFFGVHGMTETEVLRRIPGQRRSRERVERILEAASCEIAEKGSDAIRMGAVAHRAGVPIGSLYQYFPDKSAIIRTLAERANEACRGCIVEALSSPRTIDELCAAYAALISEFLEIFRADPLVRDIRYATLADKSLRDIEIAECWILGDLLADAVLRIRPDLDRENLRHRTFTIMALAEAAMRLAVSLPEVEGTALVETYTEMAMGELRRL